MMDKWNKADYYRKLNEDLINHMIDAELKIAKMQAVVDAAERFENVCEISGDGAVRAYYDAAEFLYDLRKALKELKPVV